MIFLRKRRRLSVNECLRILLLILANICAMPQPASAKFRICGFRLTMTLTALCKNQLCGGYFVPTKKRSFPDDYLLPSSTVLEQENGYERRRRRAVPSEDFEDDHFDGDYRPLSFQKRYSMAQNHVYSKRSGIASQCCEKRCSLAYLRTYCCSSFQIGAAKAKAAKSGAAYSYAAKAPIQHDTFKPQMIDALAKIGGVKTEATKLVATPFGVKTPTVYLPLNKTTVEESDESPEANAEVDDPEDAEEDESLSEDVNKTSLTVS